MLPHLLLADGSYEFLEVERSEVGYVLEVARVVGCESWLDHRDDESIARRFLAFARNEICSLGHQCVEDTDCEEKLAASEAEALGDRYADAQAGV